MRMLSYYEIRSDTARRGGAPAAAWRPRRPEECGRSPPSGAQEEVMSFSELLGNDRLFGAAVMCCLAALSIFSVGLIVTSTAASGGFAPSRRRSSPCSGDSCTGESSRS